MKKYVKPELFFEQFVLSQHIADCKLEYNDFQDENSCSANVDPDFLEGYLNPVFVEGNTKCIETFEGYCYTDSTDGANTFTS